jgi:DNA mismatch endonuclease (patch repair protein)
VFARNRLVVFCDGDFWHGRDLEHRIAKLGRGHNSRYWVSKIQRNVLRDKENRRVLEAAGWIVLRVWETDILRSPGRTADRIVEILTEAHAHHAIE